MAVMAQKCDEIAEEVHRILTAPYNVCLKNLYDISQNASSLDIEIWTEANACQIDGLVLAILNGLEAWPFCLDLITTAQSFRDTLLRRKPSLLSDLLESACNPQNEDLSPGQICVQLLAKTLPSECPLPARVPDFVCLLLSEATQRPSTASIQSLYTIVKGVGGSMIDILPRQNVKDFQTTILKLLKEQQDHAIQLLCLATLACFVQIRRERAAGNPPCPNQTLLNDSQNRGFDDVLEPSYQFFSSQKASKTLKLIVLRAIICSTSCNRITNFNHRCLTLAEVTLAGIHSSEKCSWAANNTPLVQKMRDRLLRPDIDDTARLQLSAIIVDIVGDDSEPEHASTNYQLDYGSLSRQEIESSITAKLLSDSNGSFLQGYICALLEIVATRQGQSTTHLAIRNGRHLLREVQHRMHRGHGMMEILSKIIAAPDMPQKIKTFLEASPRNYETTTEERQSGSCMTELGNKTFLLTRELCSLFLAVSMHTSSQANSMPIDVNRALLSTLSKPLISRECSNYLLTNSDDHEPHSQRSRPRTDPNNSKGWRYWLRQELAQDASDQQQKIIAHRSAIRRDLELRCENVESPLREQAATSIRLENEIKKLQAASLQLEQELCERNQHIEHIQAERAAVDEYTHGIEVQLAEAKDKLSREQSNAEFESRQVAEIHAQQKLEHLAKIAAREEAIERQAASITALENELDDANKSIDSLRQQLDESRRAFADSTKSHEQLLSEHAYRQGLASELESSLAACEEARSILVLEVQTLKEGSKVHRQSAIDMETNLKEQISNLGITLTEVRSNCALQLEECEQESHEQHTQLNLELEQMQHEIEETKDQLDHRNLHITKLQKRIDKLNTERDEISNEYAEAQERNKRLFSLMGSNKSKLKPHLRQTQDTPKQSYHVDEDESMLDSLDNTRLHRAKQSLSLSPSKSTRKPLVELRSGLQVAQRRNNQSPTKSIGRGRPIDHGNQLSQAATVDEFDDLSFADDMYRRQTQDE